MDCEKHIYNGVRGAKLAKIRDLSPEKTSSATPPPPTPTRRTPSHQLHPISTRRTPHRPPSRMFRRPRGAKLAECEEIPPEIPSDLTPPPSPSPESVDLATSSSPPALPAPTGDSPPDRSDPKLFRRLPDYSYKQAKTNLPRRLPDSFLCLFRPPVMLPQRGPRRRRPVHEELRGIQRRRSFRETLQRPIPLKDEGFLPPQSPLKMKPAGRRFRFLRPEKGMKPAGADEAGRQSLKGNRVRREVEDD